MLFNYIPERTAYLFILDPIMWAKQGISQKCLHFPTHFPSDTGGEPDYNGILSSCFQLSME